MLELKTKKPLNPKEMFKVKKVVFLLVFIGLNLSAYGQTNLMSFNIRYDNPADSLDNWHLRKKKVVQLIKHHENDFIGIQEGLSLQVNFINNSLPNHNYIGIGRNDGKEKGEYSAIFYNTNTFKEITSGTFWLSTTPSKISVGWDAAMERICTYGLFENKTTKRKIWVFNSHFDHIGKIAQENSAKLILKKIQQLNTNNTAVVFMGDLNVTPDEKTINTITSSMEDGYAITEKQFYGPPHTYIGFSEESRKSRIDYIFTKNLKVISFSHIDDKRDNGRNVSDHLPVFVTVRHEN